MFKKSILAVAAIAAAVTFTTAAANANSNITIGFGVNMGGFAPGFDYPEYEPDYGTSVGFGSFGHHGYHGHHGHHFPRPMMDYGMSCGQASNVVRAAGFRHVRAIDCSAPTYSYKAMRHGDVFKVKVNFQGQILAVRPIY
jgi:hypothetical protein